MARLITLVSAVLLTACTAAAEPSSFPYFDEEGGRVRDIADILSPDAETKLAADLDQAERDYGPQMAIVTVNSLEGYDIADYSLQYARAWGLGDNKRNDGLQLLVAPNERKVRIEVGKGLDGTFTDIYCKEVIDQAILPNFRKGDLEKGILAGTKELIEHMRQHPTIPANDNVATIQREAA